MSQEEQIASLEYVPAWSPVTAREYNFGRSGPSIGISAYEKMRSQELLAKRVIPTTAQVMDYSHLPQWRTLDKVLYSRVYNRKFRAKALFLDSEILSEEDEYNGEDYN